MFHNKLFNHLWCYSWSARPPTSMSPQKHKNRKKDFWLYYYKHKFVLHAYAWHGVMYVKSYMMKSEKATEESLEGPSRCLAKGTFNRQGSLDWWVPKMGNGLIRTKILVRTSE